MPCDEESGVGDGVWADTDMALLDEARCLREEVRKRMESNKIDERQRRSVPF